MVRALPCHGRGREFESRRIRHGKIKEDPKGLILLSEVLSFFPSCGIITCNMTIKVTRKDQGESNENIIRRFNRKVLQSGMMPLKKSQMRFTKPMSKRERRLKAIIREAHKAEKTEKIKLGLR